MCGGGSAPQPSSEEKALQAYQLQLMQQQGDTWKQLEPILLGEYGYKKVVDPYNPNVSAIVKMSDEERNALLTPEEIANRELTQKYQERQLQALEGTLPISPALEDDLARQKEQITGTLSQKLGPNWASTTPGIQAMKQFEQAANLVREEARRGQISQGQNLISQGITTQYNPQSLGFLNVGSSPSEQLGRIPGMLQPYQYYSGLGYQANQANAQNQTQLIGAGIGTVGLGAGVAAAII